MEALRPAELVEQIADGADPEAVGPFADRPIVIAELDGSSDADRLAEVAPKLPAVLVGIGEPGRDDAVVAGLDIALTAMPDPPAPWFGGATSELASALVAAVNASPQASVTLVQLLRLSAGLSIHDALVAESLAYGLLQTGAVYQRWLADQRFTKSRRHNRAPIRVERAGATLTITLDRPEVRNAFDAATRDGLVEALAVANDPGVEVVELRGTGRDFCSGGDLTEFGTVPDATTGHLIRTTRSAAARLVDLPTRTVAQLHGACIGAGIELPAFCDHVVADGSTTVSLPEVGLGLIPGAGGTASLPRRIGRQRTAWLALSGASLDAETAHRWRLVDELS